ncbi:hypothetical protein CR513_00249, partial [Mucuna pruriens]
MQQEYNALLTNKTWSEFLLFLASLLLTINEYFESKKTLMALLTNIKLIWLLMDFIKNKDVIILKPFDQLSSLLHNSPYPYFCSLQILFEVVNLKMVCKLHKAIYGLKQDLQAWYERLNIILNQFGFVHSKCVPSLVVLILLLSVIVSKPKFGYCVNKNAMKHILRYLKGTIGYDL